MFDLITCNNLFGFFCNEKIKQSDVPADLYAYYFRGDGKDNDFHTLEPKVTINCSGTFITDTEIDFGEKGYIELTEELSPNFSPEYFVDSCFYSLADVEAWFRTMPNHTWRSPLSVEVTGLTTVQAVSLAETLCKVAEKLIADIPGAQVKRHLPMENLWLLRWSIGDVDGQAMQNDEVSLDAKSLVRASEILDGYSHDSFIEQGWCTVDTAIEEALEAVERVSAEDNTSYWEPLKVFKNIHQCHYCGNMFDCEGELLADKENLPAICSECGRKMENATVSKETPEEDDSPCAYCNYAGEDEFGCCNPSCENCEYLNGDCDE